MVSGRIHRISGKPDPLHQLLRFRNQLLHIFHIADSFQLKAAGVILLFSCKGIGIAAQLQSHDALEHRVLTQHFRKPGYIHGTFPYFHFPALRSRGSQDFPDLQKPQLLFLTAAHQKKGLSLKGHK